MPTATRKHTTNPLAIAVTIALAARHRRIKHLRDQGASRAQGLAGIPDTTGGRDFARPQTGGDQ